MLLAGTTATAAPAVAGLKHYAVATFTANPAHSSHLGDQIAIAGSTLAVLGETTNSSDQASYAVYVFTRKSTGWRSSTPAAELKAPVDGCIGGIATNGRTIVLSNDCEDVDGHENQGEVLAYTEPKNGWRSTSTPSAVLNDPAATADDDFGVSLAMSGSTLVVGATSAAGAEYVYTDPPGGFTSSSTPKATLTNPTPDDEFADASAVSGNTVVVGADTYDDSLGTVWVYTKPLGGWSGSVAPSRQLSSTSLPTGGNFGGLVAISGRTVVSSVPGSAGIFSSNLPGAGYVFTEPTTGWGTTADPPLEASAVLTETAASPEDFFGQAAAVCGSRVLLAAPGRPIDDKDNSGAVDVYAEPAGGWHSMTQTSSFDTRTTARFDEFGDSVACTGTTIAVGAPFARYPAETTNGDPGAAYTFSKVATPRLTKLSEHPRRWAAGKRHVAVNPKHAPRGGTRFNFKVNEPTSVVFRFAHKHRKLDAVLSARKGVNRIYIDGPLGGGKHLTRGSWTVRITAVDAAGDRTKARTLHFTVTS